jgi:hypothetical protein
MRKELGASENIRETFTATFIRFGSRHQHNGTTATTLLFQDIRNKEGIEVADHLWFTITKGFEECRLQAGDRVRFDARVKAYSKGYRGIQKQLRTRAEHDYKLSHPTKITRLNTGEGSL